MQGLKPKVFSVIYILIKFWAKIKAHRTLTKMKKDGDLDYWKVLR